MPTFSLKLQGKTIDMLKGWLTFVRQGFRKQAKFIVGSSVRFRIPGIVYSKKFGHVASSSPLLC